LQPGVIGKIFAQNMLKSAIELPKTCPKRCPKLLPKMCPKSKPDFAQKYKIVKLCIDFRLFSILGKIRFAFWAHFGQQFWARFWATVLGTVLGTILGTPFESRFWELGKASQREALGFGQRIFSLLLHTKKDSSYWRQVIKFWDFHFTFWAQFWA